MDIRRDIDSLAEQLRSGLAGRPFGIIRFWGFAVVRPNDQSYVLSGLRIERDRLDLELVREGGRGAVSIMSIWQPDGLVALEPGQGRGIALLRAQRLRWNEAEAWRDADQYRIRTPRGEGGFPIRDAPALTLAY